MNGRAYDYNLGRFLSVDPFIQAPGNSQSMNPYSYIMNNPLSGTEPSGYIAEAVCESDNYACQWDHSIATVLGVPRWMVTEHHNGVKAGLNNGKPSGGNTKPEETESPSENAKSICETHTNCFTVAGSAVGLFRPYRNRPCCLGAV